MADEETLRAGMRSIRRPSPFPEGAREEVLDAAAVLQLRRGDQAARLTRGERTDAEVVAVGMSAINGWLYELSTERHEVLSTAPAASTDQLRHGLPLNRSRIQDGTRMVSLFDHGALDQESRILLANETIGTYLMGIAPVQMKIIDRRFVLLPGPPVDGTGSLMKVWDRACLQAAWRYWEKATTYTIPLETPPTTTDGLTARQRQIVALLAADLGDDAIATALGVSVRTVRADIAALLKRLGVRSRFAAAARLRLWDEPPES